MRTHMRTIIAVLATLATLPSVAAAQSQSITTEANLTSGYSSEGDVSAVAAQLRLFGETESRIRFNAEGTWADRSSDHTDAFGAAYPYGGRFHLSEVYAERMFQHGPAFMGVRLGQYRSPFGISSRSDHAYSGFLRAPLIRYDDYWAITNNFLERGVDLIAGTPRLSVEASVGAPGDIGVARRRSGVESVVRAQAYLGSVIVGVSHVDSQPYASAADAPGRMNFSGVDARWTFDGFQLRGEWMFGHPWSGTRTNGWYADAIVHRPFMGPVTAVFRTEALDFTSPTPFMWMDMLCHDEWRDMRQTAGGRVRLPGGFTAQVDLVRQFDELAEYGSHTALDVGLTYSFRRD